MKHSTFHKHLCKRFHYEPVNEFEQRLLEIRLDSLGITEECLTDLYKAASRKFKSMPTGRDLVGIAILLGLHVPQTASFEEEINADLDGD